MPLRRLWLPSFLAAAAVAAPAFLLMRLRLPLSLMRLTVDADAAPAVAGGGCGGCGCGCWRCMRVLAVSAATVAAGGRCASAARVAPAAAGRLCCGFCWACRYGCAAAAAAAAAAAVPVVSHGCDCRSCCCGCVCRSCGWRQMRMRLLPWRLLLRLLPQQLRLRLRPTRLLLARRGEGGTGRDERRAGRCGARAWRDRAEKERRDKRRGGSWRYETGR